MNIHFAWGDLASQTLQIFAPLIVTALSVSLMWGVRKVAPGLATALEQQQVDRLLGRALGAAIAQTEGVVAGQAVDVHMANNLLGQAAAFLISQAPGLVRKYGPQLEQMLAARLGEHVQLPAGAIGGRR